MQKVAAIHCNPQKRPALSHNDRTDNRAPNINKSLSHLNECTATAEQVRAQVNKLYEQSQKDYYNFCVQKNGIAKSSGKPKGLQNFTQKEKAITEFIAEISENSTLAQVQELAQKIADLTGFKPLQITIHRDETYTSAQGELKTHHHAHIVFYTLQQGTGLQLARQEQSLSKKNLSKCQDLAAEVLGMQRGARRFENNEPQPHYFQNHKDYAYAKELDKTREARVYSKIESEEKEAFNNLENDLNEQKSTLKNILTLGAHNKIINKAHDIAKNSLKTQGGAILIRQHRRTKEAEAKQQELREINNSLRQKLELERKEKARAEKSAREAWDKANKLYKELQERNQWLKDNLSAEALEREFLILYLEREKEQKEQLEREQNTQKTRYTGR